MARYYLHLAYDGSGFSGWQKQPNSYTVQEELEEALCKIFHHPITVFGCGRTDKGVHATQYFAHINLEEVIDFDLKFILNKNLSNQIVIYDVIAVEENQHCRYDAVKRTYKYLFHTSKSPFLDKYSTYLEHEKLDIDLMKEAVGLLPNYSDFTSFCFEPDKNKHNNCTIYFAQLLSKDTCHFELIITGNRFLKGMIRILMAYLIKLGKNKIELDDFVNMLENPGDIANKSFAKPNGLYLHKIEYPYLNRDTHDQLSHSLFS